MIGTLGSNAARRRAARGLAGLIGLIGLIARVRRWRAHRRALERLAGQPDHLLDDIGVTRAQVERILARGWIDGKDGR